MRSIVTACTLTPSRRWRVTGATVSEAGADPQQSDSFPGPRSRRHSGAANADWPGRSGHQRRRLKRIANCPAAVRQSSAILRASNRERAAASRSLFDFRNSRHDPRPFSTPADVCLSVMSIATSVVYRPAERRLARNRLKNSWFGALNGVPASADKSAKRPIGMRVEARYKARWLGARMT